MGACVMHRFFGLIARFGRDERGVFAVMFGLMAIVLIALGGAVVDYVALEQTRNRAQIALDAAALALQPEIFETTYDENQIKVMAQDLMLERLELASGAMAFGAEASVTDIAINVEDGSLYLRAHMTIPTIFVSLVGVSSLSAEIQSEATRKKLALEVAFVLDNSGSMSYTGAGSNGTRQRIQFLKDAATCATNILFYDEVVDNPSNTDTCIPATGAQLIDNVRVAVVPFTMFVNVGSGNSNATWIDRTGASVTHFDNFDNDDDEDRLVLTYPNTYTFPNRFTLFGATGESWRGCVEARPHTKTGTLATEYLDTDDSLPTGANTLYVPMFSPDMVDGVGTNTYVSDSPAVCDRPSGATCTQTQQRTSCNAAQNNGSCTTGTASAGVPSGSTNFLSSTKYANAFYGVHAPTCDCRTWGSWSSYAYVSGSGNNQTFRRTRTCSTAGYVPTGLSSRELQERICKYYQTPTSSFSSGPNADCTRTAILPLSSNPTTVKTTITGMTAEGGTNIHEGAAWGYRVLSPTLPFDQGDDYDTATSKVMILMTDGENTAYNLSTHCGAAQRALDGNCYNSAYAFPYNSRNTTATSTSGGTIERLGGVSSATGSITSTNADLVSAMNTRTYQTCENAKAAGITVYVIGLATSQSVQSTQTVVENMLRTCASTTDRAFFPQTPGELKDVFEAIADDLSALRLAQ
jgi:Flp pilus assembly pilin Flp